MHQWPITMVQAQVSAQCFASTVVFWFASCFVKCSSNIKQDDCRPKPSCDFCLDQRDDETNFMTRFHFDSNGGIDGSQMTLG